MDHNYSGRLAGWLDSVLGQYLASLLHSLIHSFIHCFIASFIHSLISAKSSRTTMTLFRRRTCSLFALTTTLWSSGGGQTHGVIGANAAATVEKECELGADGTCASTESIRTATATLAPDDYVDCGVYMAPSTLGEATNMGMYTAKPLQTDDVVNFPEIAIPLLFREWTEHRDGFDDGEIWDRYIWEGAVMAIEPYTDTNREDSRAVFVPGIGCTVNSIMDMNNIESAHGSIYDTAGLHRSMDPGAGAFCPYHGALTTATTDIPAGAELFANYGDYWIPDIPGAQVTLEETLSSAEHFLRQEFYAWMQEREASLTDAVKEALWNMTVYDFPLYSKEFSVLPKVPWKQVEAALREHPDANFSVVKQFIRQQSIRSDAWLRENGYCQDHIRPDRSTIEQAGRGAFATRRLPKGTVVGYSPLIHMALDGKEIYLIDYDEGKRKQYDLVINYSFGHRNSTVMLTPYGGMVNYINHDKERANVRVRWPDRELVAHKPEWLNKSPTELRHALEKIGLSFEYVAVRDIEEGEEVFMDYGDEWQAAWDEHVKNWKPVPNSEGYVHTTDWEEDVLRTDKELETNPYPDNFVTMCIESYSSTEDGTFTFIPDVVKSPHRVYCHVLERSDDDPPEYTVEMELSDHEAIIVHNVTTQGIFLYDTAFSADWHLPNVFRHEIMIPDDIMPEMWLNGPPPPPSIKEKKPPKSKSTTARKMK